MYPQAGIRVAPPKTLYKVGPWSENVSESSNVYVLCALFSLTKWWGIPGDPP